MSPRFTIDGSPALEARLEEICRKVLAGLLAIIPEQKLEAVVLGGGYGRGEGGVLRSALGDLPFNDMEFYVFVDAPPVLARRKFGPALEPFSSRMSEMAGLHVEFKIDSLAALRRGSVSMFSYDLVSRSRTLWGTNVFAGCEQHLEAAKIPASEATRLLFNRFGGLLMCREYLDAPEFPQSAADFVERNLAKARLALGDAVLTLHRRYHWSCRERNSRLEQLPEPAGLPDWEKIREDHRSGLTFKLHPSQGGSFPDDYRAQYQELSSRAGRLWLWLESGRLGRAFPSPLEYAKSREGKCDQPPSFRNYLLNLRTFGGKAALDWRSTRYPRERLLNSLPLLLWNGKSFGSEELRHLQSELCTSQSDWPGLVRRYKQLWPTYG